MEQPGLLRGERFLGRLLIDSSRGEVRSGKRALLPAGERIVLSAERVVLGL